MIFKTALKMALACLPAMDAALDQTPAILVGAKVVTKYAKPLRIENRIVDDGSVNRIYTVGEIQGHLLWLMSDRAEGWLEASSVVSFDLAIDFYTEQIDKRGIGEAYNWRGMIWDNKGDHARAIADYDQAIRLGPDNVWPHNNKGLALSELGQYSAAIVELDLALRLDSKNPSAYLNRGNTRLWQGNYQDALADFDEAIRLNPKNSKSYLSRSCTWLYLGNYHRAISDADEALRLNPKDAAAYNNRGAARDGLFDRDGAITDLNEALRLDSQSATAYYNRGRAWYAKLEADRAIADYDRSIELDPKKPGPRLWRGEANFCKKNYDRVMDDYEQCVQLTPQLKLPHEKRAWFLAACPDARYRDGAKAVESAKRACELSGWNDPSAVDALAASCAEAGDFDKAIQWAVRSIELSIDDPESKKGREERLALYQKKQPYRAVACDHP